MHAVSAVYLLKENQYNFIKRDAFNQANTRTRKGDICEHFLKAHT